MPCFELVVWLPWAMLLLLRLIYDGGRTRYEVEDSLYQLPDGNWQIYHDNRSFCSHEFFAQSALFRNAENGKAIRSHVDCFEQRSDEHALSPAHLGESPTCTLGHLFTLPRLLALDGYLAALCHDCSFKALYRST